jgi:predicted Zn-ribbon and HTH transcriptional regulator
LTKDHDCFINELKKLYDDEYIVLSEYLGSKNKVLIKHNIPKCGYEYYTAPSNILSGRRCPYCAGKTRDTEQFKQEVFKLSGGEYELIGEYNGADKGALIRHTKCATEYMVFPANFLRGARCSKCFRENNVGENHPNWQGGISSLNIYLRYTILPWKKDSLKKYNYCCAFTNINDNLEIHHPYSFSRILDETLIKTGLDIRHQIADYTQDELKLLEDTCLELHYEHGLGVPLLKIIHELFHQQYGQDGNTDEEDFKEFKQRWDDGEFKNILDFDKDSNNKECVNE